MLERGKTFILLSAGLVCLVLVAPSLRTDPAARASGQVGVISGRIVAVSGRLPARDVSIVVRQVSSPHTYGTLVQPDGTFVVQHDSPTGLVEIAAIANGFGVGIKRYRLQRGEHLSGLLFQLEPAGEIRGKLVDEFSAPIANGTVQLKYDRRLRMVTTPQLGTAEVMVSRDGDFVIRNIQPRIPFHLVAEGSGGTKKAALLTPTVDMLLPGERRENVVAMLVQESEGAAQ